MKVTFEMSPQVAANKVKKIIAINIQTVKLVQEHFHMFQMDSAS